MGEEVKTFGVGGASSVVQAIMEPAQFNRKVQDITNAVPASKLALTSKAQKGVEFKRTMKQKYADGTVRTLSPKNREIYGSKVCAQFESSTCKFTEPSTGSMKDGIRFELQVTETCSVMARLEIGAAADDQAAYGALEFLPMPSKGCAETTWLSAKQDLEKKVEDQRKHQLLDSLKSSGCPGFGAKNAAYARSLSRDKAVAVEAKYTTDKVISMEETGPSHAQSFYQSSFQTQPHRKLLGGASLPNTLSGGNINILSGTNTNTLSNNIGMYTARNPQPKTTSTAGYEQYDSACSM